MVIQLHDVLVTCWLMINASHLLVTAGESSTQTSQPVVSPFCSKSQDHIRNRVEMHLRTMNFDFSFQVLVRKHVRKLWSVFMFADLRAQGGSSTEDKGFGRKW